MLFVGTVPCACPLYSLYVIPAKAGIQKKRFDILDPPDKPEDDREKQGEGMEISISYGNKGT